MYDGIELFIIGKGDWRSKQDISLSLHDLSSMETNLIPLREQHSSAIFMVKSPAQRHHPVLGKVFF